ncbi:MAG: hypothetical protein ACRD0K_03270 [Egibacteraceae bacterium]
MPFKLRFAGEARNVLASMEADNTYAKKLKKVRACLGRLETDPRHASLGSHRYQSIAGPNGEEVWESYVENRTPGAWRVWWWYGPGRGEITVLTIGPHPD